MPTAQCQSRPQECFLKLSNLLKLWDLIVSNQRWPPSEPVQIWFRLLNFGSSDESLYLVWTFLVQTHYRSMSELSLNFFEKKKYFSYRLSSDSDLKLIWTQDQRENFFNFSLDSVQTLNSVLSSETLNLTVLIPVMITIFVTNKNVDPRTERINLQISDQLEPGSGINGSNPVRN